MMMMMMMMMMMITGLENVSTYWVVRRGEDGAWASRKIVLDMGRASLEIENILFNKILW